MATYINTWRNKVWIVWFVVQVPLIVCKPNPLLRVDARSRVAGPRLTRQSHGPTRVLMASVGLRARRCAPARGLRCEARVHPKVQRSNRAVDARNGVRPRQLDGAVPLSRVCLPAANCTVRYLPSRSAAPGHLGPRRVVVPRVWARVVLHDVGVHLRLLVLGQRRVLRRAKARAAGPTLRPMARYP